MSTLIKCPYCAEEIQAEAKKCRHCGEWLAEQSSGTKGGAIGRGSTDARAVAKGIKQEKLQSMLFKLFILLAAMGALLVGLIAQSALWGIGAFLVMGFLAFRWYQRE